ncbi:MAG: hypothetical protein IJ662_12400 [Clostridia bacterium]|nr:hypothetical protein [Clostridia bacterium]
MRRQTLRRNTGVFIGFLLLAGVIHIFDDTLLTPSVYGRAAMFTVIFLIYTGLLIFWIQSVHARLLPFRARTYGIASAVLMVVFLILRSFKYRIAFSNAVVRYTWYAYYLPLALIPTLFWMACIRIRRGDQKSKRDERWLLLPAGILAACFLTNDLHRLAFLPLVDAASLIGDTGTYTHGVLFYGMYLWVVLATAVGVILLLKETRKNIYKALPIAAALALWLLMITANVVMTTYALRRPYEVPEIHIFCLLLIFEICIREGLIPHNEHYAAIFGALRQPALICDQAFAPVYQTAAPVRADRAQMEAALMKDVYPQRDLRLRGKAIRGGYAFWTADESALHRLNEELEEANQVLSEENNVIAAEKELREEKARVEARSRLYLSAAEQVYPTQKEIAALLNQITPDRENLRPVMARVMVLNAYAKRRANFLLAESAVVSANEMRLALEETARYLPYCGTEAYVDCTAAADRATEDAMALYDTFEQVIEALLPDPPPYLLIAYSDDGLRLMAEGIAPALQAPNAPRSVAVEAEEGRVTVRIGFREGGAA